MKKHAKISHPREKQRNGRYSREKNTPKKYPILVKNNAAVAILVKKTQNNVTKRVLSRLRTLHVYTRVSGHRARVHDQHNQVGCPDILEYFFPPSHLLSSPYFLLLPP